MLRLLRVPSYESRWPPPLTIKLLYVRVISYLFHYIYEPIELIDSSICGRSLPGSTTPSSARRTVTMGTSPAIITCGTCCTGKNGKKRTFGEGCAVASKV